MNFAAFCFAKNVSKCFLLYVHCSRFKIHGSVCVCQLCNCVLLFKLLASYTDVVICIEIVTAFCESFCHLNV